MIGRLLSKAIRVVTLPVDAVNAALDILVGGDGSKASRTNDEGFNPLGMVENVRDVVAEAAKEIDDL